MLTQYCLTLSTQRPCQPRPEWGYRLYAALLASAPPAFGTNVHQDAVTPVSQYVTWENGTLYWNITLLGRACQETLGPVLQEQKSFWLHKDRVQLNVADRSARSVSSVEELLSWAEGCSGNHQLDFRTATAFKSRGWYRNLPTARLIIQSLIKKWNGCFPECPIEDEDGQGMDALAAGLLCQKFRLFDRTFFLKGNAIPGFVGTMTLENRLNGFHRLLADALLYFSDYAGIGVKTTLGMGGVKWQAPG